MSNTPTPHTARPRLAASLPLLTLVVANVFVSSYRAVHVAVGLLVAGLVVPHLAIHRRAAALAARRAWQVVSCSVLAGLTGVVTVSGVLTWQDVAGAKPWHSASASALFLLVLGHAGHRYWSGRARRRPATELRHTEPSRTEPDPPRPDPTGQRINRG